jgi:hypothetical protein
MPDHGPTRQPNAVKDPFKNMTKQKSKTPERKAMPEIQFGAHSRYQIKSGWLAGTFVARAFPKPPTKARGVIAEATGATEQAAIDALHALIDAREDRRTEERRVEPRTGTPVPSTEEYVEAIGQVALSRPQQAMLLALSLAGDDGLSDGGMANAAGYKSQASAHRAFVAAGTLIAEYLSVAPDDDDAETEETPEGSALLGFRGDPPTEAKPGNWVLHPELLQAVRAAL